MGNKESAMGADLSGDGLGERQQGIRTLRCPQHLRKEKNNEFMRKEDKTYVDAKPAINIDMSPG